MKKLSKEKKSLVREGLLLGIGGGVWMTGFVFGLLGILFHSFYAQFGYTYFIDTPIAVLEAGFKLFFGFAVDSRILGLILVVIAMIYLLAVFYHYANKYDEIKAKKRRRNERLKTLEKDFQENEVVLNSETNN